MRRQRPSLVILGNVAGIVLVLACSTGLVPLPIGFVGVPALFMPGFLATLCLERLSGQRAPSEHHVLWATVFSVTLTPILVYLADRTAFHGTGVPSTILPFVLVWVLVLVAVGVLVAVRRLPQEESPTPYRERPGFQEGVVGVLSFLGILAVSALLYRFIPEADGYGYLIKLRDGLLDPAVFRTEPRLIFLTFVQSAALLGGIDPYWVLKLGIPFLSLVLGLTCYLVAFEHTNDRRIRLMAALAPLSMPVVLQEILVGRPQSLVVLALVPVLYLVARISKPGAVRQLYWLLAVCGIGLLGTRIHTLSFLLAMIACWGICRVCWPIVRRMPFDSAMIGAALLILALPWLQSFRILGDLWHILGLAWQSLERGEFRWWFLSHYRNVDGTEVGWSGWSWLQYYGYMLGVLLPGIAAYAWSRRYLPDKIQSQVRIEWAAIGLVICMLVIAEILPRFGLAYLPDRAWLFIALGVTLLLPYGLAMAARHRFALTFFVVLQICSIGAGTFVTYAKQGWMTHAEYGAVQFLLKETEASSVILGQGGARPAVRYFADRTLMPPPADVFLSDDDAAVERFLADQQIAYEAARVRLRTDQQFVREGFERLAEHVAGLETAEQQQSYVGEAMAMAQLFGEGQYTDDRLEGKFLLADEQPVYLMYDRTKFNSLYGQRAWWKASNFYGADTDKFTRRYPLVYDQGDVKIWQVR